VRAVLAAAPIALVLVLMVGRGWSAARAGAATAVVTLVIALTAFDLDGGEGLVGVVAEALFLAATILAIIGPALGIHHLQQRTGATARLQEGLARLHPDPRVGALVVAWFFTLFLEGAAGFGTPVALAAPFLVASGFTPVMAVTAALLGHAAGVSFGAVGTPVLAQAGLTSTGVRELARATAPYHVLLGWVLLAAVVVIIGSVVVGHSSPWRWGMVAATSFLVPYGALAWWVGPELPTLGGALVGVVVFAGVARWHSGGRKGATMNPTTTPTTTPTRTPTTNPTTTGSLATAASPYLALIVLVLVTRLVPAVRDGAAQVELSWSLPGGFGASVRPLSHPALLLTAAFVTGAIVQRANRHDVRSTIVIATSRLGPVALALVAMLMIARAMSQGGLTAELAATAAVTGAWWPLIAPAVGALGTFVTGSATASNVLFTELQESTAVAASVPVEPVLGAQGFGAAVGNVICPHNVVAAMATVGASGQEGAVLRRTLPPAMLHLALGGLLALAFTA
jgi:lactate permease